MKESAVNSSIIIGTARCIISHDKKSLLIENWLGTHTVYRLGQISHARMGLSKRRATKGAKSLSNDFEEMRQALLH